MTYYFTYGADNTMYHKGGWTRLDCPEGTTIEQAIAVFTALRPSHEERYVHFAGVYPANVFHKTNMYLNGDNWGAREHDHITISEESNEIGI